jgi:apolipoprotein N-acyltransferase
MTTSKIECGETLSTERYATLRTSWLWLGLSVAAILCTHGNWIVPLAGWLYPFFLLRFTRGQHPLVGFLGVALVLAVSGVVLMMSAEIPLTLPFGLAIVLTALFLALPFLLDRLLTWRWSPWVSTLLFPLGYVAVSYLKGLVDPLGTLGSLAYTQYGNLPLLQVLSVTGISGIIFLMTWFASLLNWIIEQGWRWPRMRAGVVLYAAILALVFLGGSMRLLVAMPPSTVRVASLSVPVALEVQASHMRGQALQDLNAHRATPADLTAFRSNNALLLDNLLARTRSEASAGAKIVLWPECGVLVLQADEPTFLAQTGAVARQAGIYLDMGVCVLNNQDLPDAQDQSILLNPSGQVVWAYEKAHPVPGLDTVVQGNGVVPVVETPYGRLSTVICFDEDFPALLQQAGHARTDLLLAPSNDWQAIDPWHTDGVTFRALEEGFSLVRETSNGLSIAVDAEGRTLAAVDSFQSDSQSMVAFVPTRGTRTLYAHVGDLFAWLCCLSWLALIVGASIQGRKCRTQPGAEQIPVLVHWMSRY